MKNFAFSSCLRAFVPSCKNGEVCQGKSAWIFPGAITLPAFLFSHEGTKARRHEGKRIGSLLKTILFILAFFGFATVGFASLTTEQKEAALAAEVEEFEAQWKAGAISSNDDEVLKAKLALYTFRRDAAGDVKEKIAQQEKIVQCLADKVKEQEAMYKAGAASDLDVRKAKVPLLDAQEKLEELKLKQKK